MFDAALSDNETTEDNNLPIVSLQPNIGAMFDAASWDIYINKWLF